MVPEATAKEDLPRSSVELIETVEGVLDIGADWRRLQAQGAATSPFLSWGWMSAWLRNAPMWRQSGSEEAGSTTCSPWVIVVRDESDGAPLLIWPMQRDRHAGLRRLTWLSVPATQAGGVLMAPMSAAGWRALFEEAWRLLCAAPVDFLDFRLLPAGTPLADFLLPRCRRGMDNAEYCVDLSAFADWRAYELALKPSARRARKKRLNRMRKAGVLRFVVHDDPDVITARVDLALDWKRRWLAARGVNDGLPGRSFFAAFLKDLARTRGHGGASWRMAELSLDGRPVALDFGAVQENAFYAFLSAYDPAAAGHSPGKVALWLMLQWCMEQGLSVYDMLANPAPYKEDWANVRSPLLHLVRPLSLGGHAYALWASRLREMAQHCYDALPNPLRAPIAMSLRRLRDGAGRDKR